jgi:serine/threonine protein kinase
MEAGQFELWPAFQIPRTVSLEQSEFFLEESVLPKQYIDGSLRPVTSRHQPRCTISYGPVLAHGRNGVISYASRTPGKKEAICIKRPMEADFSLCAEALIQWICSRSLESAGIYGAVPAVHDIFQYAGETRFSMDFIEGVSAVDAMLQCPEPDTLWLQILAQAALILGYLEENVRLDHRDLKANNLWIRQRPVQYSLKVGGIQWEVTAPFQVVILDFGFSCIGNDAGNAIVSLSDGVVPKIDPCPKEGRDLFQLVASMWSVEGIRDRIGSEIAEDIELLLKHRAASYIDMVKDTTKSHWWVYLTVSHRQFKHPPLHPVSLLQKLAHEWYPTAGVIMVGS